MVNPSFDFFPKSTDSLSSNSEPNPDPVPPPIVLNTKNPYSPVQLSASFFTRSRHHTAQTHVDNSFGNSFEFTKNNIYATHVLLEACKVTNNQIKHFIHVSTDEVYGETEAEAIVGNHEASQLLQNKPLPIHGNGSNVRSYLYYEDVAEAFECILHKGVVGQVYNIGTKKERRVIDVAKDICNLFNLDYKKSIKMVDNRPFNDQCYILDDKKLIALGWQERTSWVDGLQKTKDWYIANPS
jgi:UDP-glucose 4,6-dehydratase